MGEGVIEERCRPFCCRQLYADLLLPLAEKEDTWHVWVYAHAEDIGGHECPLLLSTLVSWDRVCLWSWSSLSPQEGWQATKGQPHCTCLGGTPWSHLPVVHAGWEQSPGPQAYARMLLPANPSLCLHVSFWIIFFFLIWTCLQRVYFQIVSLHLPTSWWSYFLFLSSSAFCMEGTRLQSGSKRWFSRCYIQSYISKKLLLSRVCSPVL